MATLNFPVKTIERFCVDAFEKFGFTRKEAEQITDVLLLADVYGIASHGTQARRTWHSNALLDIRPIGSIRRVDDRLT